MRSALPWLKSVLLATLMVASSLVGQWAHAADGGVQAVPALTGRVIDQTATLTEAQRQALEAKLAGMETQLGSQLVVLMVPTTLPEDIASYGQRVADTWKIGRRDVGDGLLVIVAKNDRRVRIEVAKTLEGAIPDLAAKQIIDRAITPAFRAGDYAGGLNQAVDQLTARVKGESLPLPEATGSPASRQQGFDWRDLGVFLFIGVPVIGGVLSSILGRKLGSATSGLAVGVLSWLATTSVLVALGAGAIAAMVVAAMAGGVSRGRGGHTPWGGFGGGGGGFGGGGGGFSSGGGGDFGGGGASGNW